MEPSWQPGNDLEHALLDAVQAQDAARYAQLVLEATFYVPALAEHGTPERDELIRRLAEQLGVTEYDLPIFTSLDALVRFLGPFAHGHAVVSFAELRRDWPENNPGRVIIDPGLPIGAILPPALVPAIADGSEPMAPADEMQDAVMEEMRDQARKLVLGEFGGGQEPRTPVPPSNDLESALDAALESRNEDAFLEALVAGEVVIPTTAPVPVRDDVPGLPPIPWRVMGTETLPVIPVFSSTAALERVAGPGHPSTTDLLFNVFARWPDEYHVLCFNPGAATEVILTGQAVLEMLDLLLDQLSSGGGGD